MCRRSKYSLLFNIKSDIPSIEISKINCLVISEFSTTMIISCLDIYLMKSGFTRNQIKNFTSSRKKRGDIHYKISSLIEMCNDIDGDIHAEYFTFSELKLISNCTSYLLKATSNLA